jgi:hypothetical protein
MDPFEPVGRPGDRCIEAHDRQGRAGAIACDLSEPETPRPARQSEVSLRHALGIAVFGLLLALTLRPSSPVGESRPARHQARSESIGQHRSILLARIVNSIRVAAPRYGSNRGASLLDSDDTVSEAPNKDDVDGDDDDPVEMPTRARFLGQALVTPLSNVFDPTRDFEPAPTLSTSPFSQVRPPLRC